MLIGYLRVSKNDGSQNTNLQQDALIAAGKDSSESCSRMNCRYTQRS
jgi:DNA invertase Pin-like site-specific DNA recombinase